MSKSLKMRACLKLKASVRDTAAVYAMSDIAYTSAVYAITATGKR